MDTARIAALLEPFLESSLSPAQLDQVSIYIDLLLRWNARINLTAIRKEEEIVTRHFGESFFMASHLFPATSNPCHPERSQDMRFAHVLAESKDPSTSSPPAPPQGILPAPAPCAPSNLSVAGGADGSTGNWQPATGNCISRVLDIGSGAGFPALPLKIWTPQIHLTLIESNHKKAAFLREVARALTLTNINVITDRTETLLARSDFPRADVVTLRAVEHFATILPQAAAFLAPGGCLALLIGTAQIPHLAGLKSVQWRQPINVPKSHSRMLSIGIHK